jgi:hypothetical protein
MITLKEAYGSADIIKLFPKPDYSYISSNIIIHDAEWIKFEDIYIDDEGGNIARADSHDGSHVEDLKFSFSNGVLVNEELGAVVRQPEGSPQPYKLLYGYGRTLSQQELGVEGWAFNIIDANQTVQEDIASAENEPKAPKKNNQERDIINIKSKQVKEGRIPNNEEAIYENLKRTYPRRKKESLDRIAAGIYETNATPLKYAYYTESKITNWRKNHASVWFEIDGKWDISRQSFGYTSKIGGLYRTEHRARRKYASTGFKSYVNVFAGQVTKGSTLEQQRLSILNEYIQLRVDAYMTYGKDVKFFTLNGFFPQSYGVEKWSDFVLVDQNALEKKVKEAIALSIKTREMQSAA